MIHRTLIYDALAVLAVSVLVFVCLLYAQFADVYDTTTLLVCVMLPLAIGSAILAIR